MALRLASTEAKRIDLADGDWVDVRTDLAKRDFNALIRQMPEKDLTKEALTVSEGLAFQGALFEALVIGWSLDVPATVENYLALAQESTVALDQALADHFGSMTPSPEEGKGDSTSRG